MLMKGIGMGTILENSKLLIENRDIIRNIFKMSGEEMLLAGSSFYVGIGHTANEEAIRDCEKILKENTGIFSDFRGNARIPLICKMAIAENPKQYFLMIEKIVDQMKHLKWINAQYKILAAMTIYDYGDMDNISDIIDKMTELFKRMKEKHPWLTSDEDISFAAMLAISNLDVEKLIDEMEVCYAKLKTKFNDSNAMQSVSHVLSLDEADAEEKCSRLCSIFNQLKEKKHKYGTGYEMTVLGTMSILDIPVEQIVDEIIESDEFLKQQKGFGDFVMGEKRRRMYAALMVMDSHIPPADRSHKALLNTTMTLVIAMQICMICVISAVVVAPN